LCSAKGLRLSELLTANIFVLAEQRRFVRGLCLLDHPGVEPEGSACNLMATLVQYHGAVLEFLAAICKQKRARGCTSQCCRDFIAGPYDVTDVADSFCKNSASCLLSERLAG
jgi:hypothetical protein